MLSAAPKFLLKNTELVLDKFKWLYEDFEDYDDAPVIEVVDVKNDQQNYVSEDTDEDINETFEEANDDIQLPNISDSVSALDYLDSTSSVDLSLSTTDLTAYEIRSNLDISSFEVVSDPTPTNSPKENKEHDSGNGDNTMLVHMHEIAAKTTSALQDFVNFIQEHKGNIFTFTADATKNFLSEPAIIGDILSTAIHRIKSGTSYLFGEMDHQEDFVHFSGYKLRAQGMELFIDAIHPHEVSNNEMKATSDPTKVQFQFKLSNSLKKLWKNDDEKSIVHLPSKVYWANQDNVTSLLIRICDGEINVEMPVGVSKESVIVHCDPQQAIVIIVAPLQLSQNLSLEINDSLKDTCTLL